MYGLKTEAAFDSAHFLADYYGKCENLHGHRWRVVVYVEQDELQTEGTMRDMVLDFGVFKRAVRALAEELDHTFLVEEGTASSPPPSKRLKGRASRLRSCRFAPQRKTLRATSASASPSGAAGFPGGHVRDAEQLRRVPPALARLWGRASADAPRRHRETAS